MTDARRVSALVLLPLAGLLALRAAITLVERVEAAQGGLESGVEERLSPPSPAAAPARPS